jgi:hypothetical protein
VNVRVRIEVGAPRYIPFAGHFLCIWSLIIFSLLWHLSMKSKQARNAVAVLVYNV